MDVDENLDIQMFEQFFFFRAEGGIGVVEMFGGFGDVYRRQVFWFENLLF